MNYVPTAVADLRERGASVEVIFLECSNVVLETRYRETRRVHPLSPGGTVEEGIERERELLADVARLADVSIDTSAMNVHQLKEAVVRNVTGTHKRTIVNLVSFGFRHGNPHNLELLFDLRCLPNPYFEAHLQARSGLEPDVAKYVLESERGANMFRRIQDLIEYLAAVCTTKKGKAYLDHWCRLYRRSTSVGRCSECPCKGSIARNEGREFESWNIVTLKRAESCTCRSCACRICKPSERPAGK